MIGRTMLAAAAATMTLPFGTAVAQDGFACRYGDSDTSIIADRASNFGMQMILGIYRNRWDAIVIRQECEAYANGQPHTIDCLDGRRDWDAIEASVPDDYYGMSTSQLSQFVVQERNAGDDRSEALEYCRSVGAID